MPYEITIIQTNKQRILVNFSISKNPWQRSYIFLIGGITLIYQEAEAAQPSRKAHQSFPFHEVPQVTKGKIVHMTGVLRAKTLALFH